MDLHHRPSPYEGDELLLLQGTIVLVGAACEQVGAWRFPDANQTSIAPR